MQSYGGYVWSGEPAQKERNPWATVGSLGLLAAGGVTAGAYLTTGPGSQRRLDTLARVARTAGNLSPFQIGNTFRTPEFLSPFTSPNYQELSPAGDKFSMSIGKEHLRSTSTYSYLKQLTGMSDTQLSTAGITPKMIGAENQLASELVFERTADRAAGSLYSVVGGERKLLHANTMLMQFTGEAPNLGDLSTRTKPVNKAAKGVFQAMNMWQDTGFSEASVFASGADDKFTRPKFIPIPGLEASWQGTAYARAFPAFAMERFNQLLGNIGDEVLGQPGTRAVGKLLGLGNVTSGPALHMYGRFGARAAGVVGVGLAINELDWLRRQGGVGGNVVASGIISAGIGAAVGKAGFGPKASFFAGLASFAGQMILPGFEQGVMPGIATTWAMGTELRASDMNPYNYYRRTLEGFLPGISGAGVGVLAGLAVVGLANARIPGRGQRVTDALLQRYGHATFGIASKTGKHMPVMAPKTTREHFWDMMIEHGQKNLADPEMSNIYMEYQRYGKRSTLGMRNRTMAAFHRTGGSAGDISKRMNTFWAQAEERQRTLASVNPVNEVLRDRLETVATKYHGRGDLMSRAAMQAEGMFEQLKHSFFGAHLHEEALSGAVKKLGFASPLGKTGLLFAAGFLGHQVLTGGLLGSMQSREDLQDLYSGKTLVDVKKGRGWEMGGTPFEGLGAGQLRPHWYPIMMNRAKQAGVWGSEEDRLSPTAKFLLSNFTYELERRQYYDRPYPISSAAFSNIPLIGPALGATVGQLIKPAKLMHSGEWIRGQDGNLEFASVYEGYRREPAYELGAMGPGVPTSPFSPKSVFGDFAAQFQDLGGLVGWAAGRVTNMVTGDDTFFNKDPRLAESGMMTSYRKYFWDTAMGGGGPIGEVVRRVLPQYSKDYERVNPIINNMPTWLPDKLKYGDPYGQLPFGEAILPGPGYSKLHPELQRMDPEDYPLVYRYDILAQAAPLSEEFRQTRDRLYQERARGYLSPEQEQWVDRIDQVVKKKWNMYDFERVDDRAIQLPGSNLTQAAWFQAQKSLRKHAAPLEYLVPGGFRPIQKFLGDRDAIEQYEYERLYGTPFSFWDKPVRDYLRPSITSLANWMGWEGKPRWRKEADAVNQYFDQVEFEKWMSLAQEAAAAGNMKDKVRYEYMAGNTRMGVNPQGNPLSIYWTLPPEDRAYFNAFAYATGKDRERVLDMVPVDQTHLYQSIWSRMDGGDPTLWAGGPNNPDQGYLYRQQANMGANPMPPEDWIGWNADVDLRDIKVRYVSEMGKDMRDYGLWESEMKKAFADQPFLEGSTTFLHRAGGPNRGAITMALNKLFNDQSTGRSNFSFFTSNSHMSTARLEYDDNRQAEIDAMMQGYVGGGI